MIQYVTQTRRYTRTHTRSYFGSLFQRTLEGNDPWFDCNYVTAIICTIGMFGNASTRKRKTVRDSKSSISSVFNFGQMVSSIERQMRCDKWKFKYANDSTFGLYEYDPPVFIRITMYNDNKISSGSFQLSDKSHGSNNRNSADNSLDSFFKLAGVKPCIVPIGKLLLRSAPDNISQEQISLSKTDVWNCGSKSFYYSRVFVVHA